MLIAFVPLPVMANVSTLVPPTKFSNALNVVADALMLPARAAVLVLIDQLLAALAPINLSAADAEPTKFSIELKPLLASKFMRFVVFDVTLLFCRSTVTGAPPFGAAPT